MNNKKFIGLDIGASHIKATSIDEDLNVNVEIYPIWKSSLKGNINRINLMNAVVKHIIKEKIKKYGKVDVNIVTSIEMAYPSFNYLDFFNRLSQNLSQVNIYTINEKFVVTPLHELESWANLSVSHALGYIGGKLIDTGILIHMNSSSTIFVPVLVGNAVSQEVHYSSGLGMWIGALYTDIHMISNESFIFGKKSLISPSSVTILDILLELDELSLKNIMSDYKSPVSITEEYKKDSFYRLLKLLGCFPTRKYKNSRSDKEYDLKNQVKISSLYIYYKLLNIVFENVIKILSDLDIPLNNLKLLLSGIGKDFILPDALYLFNDKLIDVESYIPKPYCIFLESFSAALSLYEYITNSKISLHEIKWGSDK
ncbi:hypothetical protein E3E31_11525 [Thermococcus sp. M39]|uniref:hypothetical protein n=1 Tax=unclassified Thermococcus TaxID=2627626 RepID=UPI00143A4F57|nr:MULTISPECIES: hypothetical protein [unclassified Thermococcus]NJE09143.1 hypothetical protein [Thermococcus sp. M39]NJE13062.1 hypothetical protein [Thermococcus sp. LS2]